MLAGLAKGGHAAAPAHTAEKGMNRTAGAQEDVVMAQVQLREQRCRFACRCLKCVSAINLEASLQQFSVSKASKGEEAVLLPCYLPRLATGKLTINDIRNTEIKRLILCTS